MDNKGVLSLDSEKFDEALEKNFEQVVAIFGGENGVAGKMATALEDYSKTGGLLAQREDSLNADLRTLTQKEADAAAQLVKYESSLRARYGGLDTLLAKMNQSASYLSLINTSSSSS
ncbi:Flagellar hook-associated protein 2 [compost metagenome]